MDIIYSMPGQSHRMFINVVYSCPNSCFFCVDFKGDTFFGFDLKNRRPYGVEEIFTAVEKYPQRQSITEVYFCGIGESLLRYDTVIEAAKRIRVLFSPNTTLALNTSGTFYLRNPRVDFSNYFDLIQISLNAENEDKYNEICRPKVKGTYQAVMAFLHDLKQYIETHNIECRVELSVVDTSDVENLPTKEKLMKVIPIPDFDACQKIADSFGWPLKIINLMKDCEGEQWHEFSEEIRLAMKTGNISNAHV